MHDISKMLSVITVVGLLSISLLPKETPMNLVEPIGVLELHMNEKPREFFSHGSGVFITPTKFLTAAHVVDKLAQTDKVSGRIRTSDGGLYTIKSVVIEPDHDIAYVTVDKAYTGYIPEISCDAQVRGTQLTTIGSPLTMEFIQTKVLVAGGSVALAKQQNTVEQNQPPRVVKPEEISPKQEKMVRPNPKKSNLRGQEFFQGVVLPGQSGSPLYTDRGQIVGVVSISVIEQNIGSFTGLGLYVKTASVCDFLQKALKK